MEFIGLAGEFPITKERSPWLVGHCQSLTDKVIKEFIRFKDGLHRGDERKVDCIVKASKEKGRRDTNNTTSEMSVVETG
jgi:hypothetical protein